MTEGDDVGSIAGVNNALVSRLSFDPLIFLFYS